MTLSGPAHRTRTPPLSRVTRSFEYLFAIALNMLFLYVVNVWPGWQTLPFLTEGTPQVLSLLNVALAAGIALNAAYLAYDAAGSRIWATSWRTRSGSPSWRASGRFSHSTSPDGAVLLTYALLVVTIVVIAIRVITNLVLLMRARRDSLG